MSYEVWSGRRLGRRRVLRGAGIGASGLAAAVLIGCGDDEEGGSGSGGDGGGSGTGGATGTATQAAGMMPTGGHLSVGLTLEPSSLDPHLAVSGGDDYHYNGIFETLVSFDSNGAPEDNEGLSESHEVVDETTLVFKLRQGIKFHDGSDFTSESVKFSIERAQNPDFGSIAFSALQSVESVETPDEFTARLTLNRPDPDLIYNLGGRYGGWMLSPSAVEAAGAEVGAKPVGTGPFRFVEWISGSHTAWEKNPDYWRKDANGEAVPYLDQVTLRIIPDATTRLAALTNNDIQISGIDAKDVSKVEGDSNLSLTQREGTGLASVIIFNKSIAPFDNVNLRRAVVWGVDPSVVNQSVYLGRNIVADGWGYPPGTWAYQPIEGRPTYDPKKAQEYLDAAGASDGLDFTAITYSAPTVSQQTEVYQEQLRQMKLNMTVDVGDVGQATQDFFAGGAAPMYSTSWSQKVVPDTLVSPTLSADGYYNPAKATDPELQDLIDQARVEYDQEARKELYTKIGVYAMDQALYVPMLYTVSFLGVRNAVGGVDSLYDMESRWRYDGIWLES